MAKRKYKTKSKAQAGINIPGVRRRGPLTEEEIIPGVNAPLTPDTPWTTPPEENMVSQGLRKGIIIPSQRTDEGFGFDPSAERAYNQFQEERDLRNEGIIKGFNTLATGVTGVANFINNNRLKNRERLQVLQSLEPRYWENMEREGLNNIPMYTKYGGSTRKYAAGGLSMAKAKKILKDGSVNGQPLTEKQKNYFGWVAGGSKKQTGGAVYQTQAEVDAANAEARRLAKAKGLSTAGEAYVAREVGEPIVQFIDAATGLPVTNTSARVKPLAKTLPSGITMSDIQQDQGVFWYNDPQTGDPIDIDPALVNLPRFRKTPEEITYDQVVRKFSTRKFGLPNNKSTSKLAFQAGGNDAPAGYHFMPDGSLMLDTEMYNGGEVEAEAGEIIESDNGAYFKIPDNANSHEEGGVNIDNVSRVLEDTSDKRKDKASKSLRIMPKEAEAMLGIKIKSPVSHAKAFELVSKNLDKKQKQYQDSRKNANLKTQVDKAAIETMKLNDRFQSELPSTDDIFDVLFDHQEIIKDSIGINDDGSLAKHGGYPKRGSRYYNHMQAGGRNFSSKEAYRKWLAYGHMHGDFEETPGSQSIKIKGQQHRVKHKAQAGTSLQGRQNISRDLRTPKGNPNAITFPGGVSSYVDAWSALIPEISNVTDPAQAQRMTYEYLLKNDPELIDSTIWGEGLNRKGIQAFRSGSNPALNEVVKRAFTSDFKVNPNYKFTQADREALASVYDDSYLMNRLVVPERTTKTVEEYPTTVPAAGTPTAQGAPLNTGVVINPNFRRQPENRFFEPTYWSDIAAPLTSFAESFNRSAELYNPVEFNQLRLKQMDPTAALAANQADFRAGVETIGDLGLGSGVAASNVASLTGQKYRINNQILAQYDQQNAAIKNQEIQYNTGVRDRQAIADAKTRADYFRDVQLGRENQRQQRLRSLEDLARVDQMKRRQNRSGNLVLKLSPAFGQEGEYTGYQYVPVLPPELGFGTTLAQPTPSPRRRTTTTTTTTMRTPDGRVVKTKVG